MKANPHVYHQIRDKTKTTGVLVPDRGYTYHFKWS